jgi:cytochrome c-type biogenesis protein CcmF
VIPEVGHFALILALLLAVTQAVLPLAGAARGVPEWMAVGPPAAFGQLTFVAIAFGCLAYAFLTNDFSVENVAHNSFSQLPPVYRLTATWGSHEGSLLLWTLLLALWTAAVAALSGGLPAAFAARVVGVMGLVSAGFLLFILTASSPFARLFPVPPDGADLNPLLQDPAMVAHPPMLYMGYVGFSVAFAFAIAALLSGRLDATWARWSRPWTTAAWVFLTLGIALGSWWAYYELGWGGWWFWDPTENASLMPWLTGTALIHSLAVTEKRGVLRAWTLLLAIATFSLSLIGTFLVRSGVLSSVHAFALDPTRGVFILSLLVLVIGGSLAVYVWRGPRLAAGGPFALLSRESFLLANNVLLATAAGSVLLGTLYPLFLDALGYGKVSVGPPYFDAVFVPLALPALFLMGAGPLASWRKVSTAELARRLAGALLVTAGVAAALALTVGPARPLAGLSLALAAWLAATVFTGVGRRLRLGDADALGRALRRSRGFYGMSVAHLGVAVCVVGVTLVSAYESEREVRMSPGDTLSLAGYTLRFDGVERVPGPNYLAARGRFAVSRGGEVLFDLLPEKRLYNASGNTMTEAAIDYGLTRDLYVSLGDPLGQGAWSVRAYHKPFVTWIWAGAVLAALGGLLALSDGRYRLRAARRRTARVVEPRPIPSPRAA